MHCRRGQAGALTFQAGGVPSQLGLRKQPCFLHFKGFSLGHPVDFPGALAWGRDHRQVALGGE